MTAMSIKTLFIGVLCSMCALAGPADAGLHRKAPRGGAVLGREFKVRYGQQVMVKGENLRVSFDAMLEDSRCPTGVTCVWAGDAKVRIGARQTKGEAVDLELHTNSQFAQTGTYQQYTIKLVALDPYPKADVEKAQKDYVATLLITKAP